MSDTSPITLDSPLVQKLIAAHLVSNDPDSQRLQLINKSEFLVKEVNEIQADDPNIQVADSNSATSGAYYTPLPDGATPSAGHSNIISFDSSFQEIDATPMPGKTVDTTAYNFMATLAHELEHALERTAMYSADFGTTVGLPAPVSIASVANNITFHAQAEALGNIAEVIAMNEFNQSPPFTGNIGITIGGGPTPNESDVIGDIPPSLNPQAMTPDHLRSDQQLAATSTSIGIMDTIALKNGDFNTSTTGDSYRAYWLTGAQVLAPSGSAQVGTYTLTRLDNTLAQLKVSRPVDPIIITAMVDDLITNPTGAIVGSTGATSASSAIAQGVFFTANSATRYVELHTRPNIRNQIYEGVSSSDDGSSTGYSSDSAVANWNLTIPVTSSSPIEPTYILNGNDDGSWNISTSYTVGTISTVDIQEVDSNDQLSKTLFGVGNWLTDATGVTSESVDANSLVAMNMNSGSAIDFNAKSGQELDLSQYSAQQVGNFLNSQQDDISDPKLGLVSQTTLPDGTVLFKSGPESITTDTAPWLDGQSFTQTVQDVITPNDIKWQTSETGQDESSTPIVSMVGINNVTDSDPLARFGLQAFDVEGAPNMLFVGGSNYSYFHANGDNTVVGGLGELNLQCTSPSDSIDFYDGGGQNDIYVNGPENLHLGTGVNLITLSVMPDSDIGNLSYLTMTGFNSVNDIMLYTAQSYKGFKEWISMQEDKRDDWLTPGGETGSRPSTIAELLGYTGFVQDPWTGNETVAGGAGNDFIAGGPGTLNATEAGGNDTIAGGEGNATIATGLGQSHIDLTAEASTSVDNVTAGGTDTIYGGMGTLVASMSGGYANTDGRGNATLNLGSAGTLVDSYGNDVINASTGNDTVNAYRTATINGSTGSNTFSLAGDEVLNSNGADSVTVSSAALVSISGTGPSLSISDLASASTSITDTYQGATAALTVAVASLSPTRASSTATQINIADGNVSVTTGSPYEELTFSAGKATVSNAQYGVTIIEGTASSLVINDSGFGTVITGGASGFTLAGLNSIGSDTITTAAGSTNTIGLGTGSDTINSAGTDIINVGAATATITSTGSVTVTQTTGTTMIQENGTTASSATVVGGLATITGAANLPGLTINTSATGVGTQITLGQGNNSITSFGPTTVVGGSGLMIFTGHANANVTDGPGGEQVQMGSGNTLFTTMAGTHNTLNLGSGTQQVFSAGNDNIYAGSGNVSVSGSAGTILLYASTGTLGFIGGSGASTIHGKTSGGGAMNVTGGSGALTVTGSSANDSVVGGAGSVNFAEGNGAATMQFGSGNATVTGGAGADLYTLVMNSSSGIGTISGFKVGTDHLHLVGYAGSEAQTALANEKVSGGNTILTFTGGEHLTLNGVSGLTAASFS